MGKKDENVMNGAMIVPENVIERFISAMEKQADKDNYRYEKKEAIEAAEWRNEKDLIKKEFKRIVDLMTEQDPTTDKYTKLVKALNLLKDVIGYSW